MLQWMPGLLKGLFNAIGLAVHTVFWCIPLYFFYGLRCISPSGMLAHLNKILLTVGEGWIRTNNLLMKLTHRTQWEVSAPDDLTLNQSYFIICNHQTWTDILLLQKYFLGKIPFIRFFIKKELLGLPFIGLAWLAFDFPIMHRYSKEKIAKNPHLRGRDITNTLKACEKYKGYPVTILNFLEGTRFTPSKQQQQSSPYQHLLKPKTGGFAYVINAMDKRMTNVLDVTIAYPEGRLTFWDFLCGKVHKVVIKIREFEVPAELLQGNYAEDPEYQQLFKKWVDGLWLEKDQQLRALL